MTTLRPFLSSIHLPLILDNVKIIINPHQPEAAALYPATEELSQIKTISLVPTTLISTVPTTCRQVEVLELSMTSAIEVFYNIYVIQGRSPKIDFLLRQLDYHPLSTTLLATAATQNR